MPSLRLTTTRRDGTSSFGIIRGWLDDLAWKRASDHYCGTGLGAGAPDLTSAAGVISRLRDDGSFDEARALETVVTARSWTQDRLHDAHLVGGQSSMRAPQLRLKSEA